MNASTTTRLVPFDAPALQRPRDRSEERRERAEECREQAASEQREGFAAGREAGLAAAAVETARIVAEHRQAIERLERAALALEAATADLERRDAVTVAEVERAAIELAVELAAELVGRELAVTEQPVLDALQRTASLLPTRGDPIVRVHPDDATTAEQVVASESARWTATARVLADDSVEPGGCVVEVGPCRIDGQVSAAIDRMRAVLVGA